MQETGITNILVTGANGYIGYHLCKELASQKNIRVYGIDLGMQTWENPAYEYTKADIREPDFEKKLPDKIQVVVHLAQSPRYREFPDGAEDMIQVNMEGTFRLLEWARITQVEKFIFTSTGNVYAPAKEPLTEQHPCHAGSFYAASKISAEQIAAQYAGFFSVMILRLFGVYGPGQQNMLVPGIINKIQAGEKITLAQDAGLYITPIFIHDLTNVISRLALLDTEKGFEVFNIAGDETLSLKEIAETISRELKLPLYTEVTEAEPAYLVGNNEKVKKIEGGGYLRTNFLTGIRETLKHEYQKGE